MHRQITTIPRIKSQFAYGSGLEQAAADLRSVLTLSTVKNKLKSFLFSQDCI